MKRPEADCKLISLTRPRTFRSLGDHPDRPVDKRAVPPALQSSKLPPRLSQDVDNVLCCGLSELMIQGCLGGCRILRVQLGSDFGVTLLSPLGPSDFDRDIAAVEPA